MFTYVASIAGSDFAYFLDLCWQRFRPSSYWEQWSELRPESYWETFGGSFVPRVSEKKRDSIPRIPGNVSQGNILHPLADASIQITLVSNQLVTTVVT